MNTRNNTIRYLFIILMSILLSFTVFINLDQGEQPKKTDVIIVPEGSSVRAYKAVDLLMKGFPDADKLIVSPGTEYNLPHYLKAGAEKDQLILEENATSTWTNATNTIEIMEENNWNSALVVTTDYHTKRTRLSFERASLGKDMDFTYVSTYHKDNRGKPVTYLDREYGRFIGLRETAKYFGYLFELYHVIDIT